MVFGDWRIVLGNIVYNYIKHNWSENVSASKCQNFEHTAHTLIRCLDSPIAP